MPAMIDDPTAPVIYRVSGEPPYPTPGQPSLPENIYPRQVTLRDRITLATLLPFASADQVPPRLLAYLSEQLNREIELGDTYPMITAMTVPAFGTYWFQNFGAIMVMGEMEMAEELHQMEHSGADWSKICLGSFYVKPNYPGRSSHICNGGFLVTDAARNKGVGRLMGEVYLEWAPQLGYTYSVFNLVYETNVVSCRIWDALGFKRIGRVKGAGALRSHPDELIDAIVYGRDLGPEGEDFVSEERFDKIRYYLKHSKYPAGADRAEKSRLRSAATHYKLVPNPDGSEERLMLKDKEVVADPQRQYEIARQVHVQTHGGINKTTASIAERYHWVRIKETVSLVIKNCPDCKESNKSSNARPEMGNAGTNGGGAGRTKPTTASATAIAAHDPNREIERLVSFDQAPRAGDNGNGNGTRRNRKPPPLQPDVDMQNSPGQPTPQTASQPDPTQQMNPDPQTPQFHHHQQQQPHPHHQQPQMQQPQFAAPQHQQPPPQPHQSPQHPPQQQQQQQQQQAAMAQIHVLRPYDEMPLDPQMMSAYGAPHGLAGNPMGHPSLGGHPGMPGPPNAQHMGADHQAGMGPPGMGHHPHHPMGDPTGGGLGGHGGVDQHHGVMGSGHGGVDQHGVMGGDHSNINQHSVMGGDHSNINQHAVMSGEHGNMNQHNVMAGMPGMGGMGPPPPGPHPGAFDLGGMGGPPPSHQQAMGMVGTGEEDHRMDGGPGEDGDIGRHLMDAGYGGGGHGGP